MVKITGVEKNSRAAKRGICAGDILMRINGNEINDVLDYRFYLTECAVSLTLLRDGEEYTVDIKKGSMTISALILKRP